MEIIRERGKSIGIGTEERDGASEHLSQKEIEMRHYSAGLQDYFLRQDRRNIEYDLSVTT